MKIKHLSNNNGKYIILKLDIASQLAQILDLDLKKEDDSHLIQTILMKIEQAFSPYLTGLILDPIYGYNLVNSRSSNMGLALTVDSPIKTKVNEFDLPEFIPDWDLVSIANHYACAEVSLRYHPQNSSALKKKKVISELHSSAKMNSVDFILNLELVAKNGIEVETEFDQYVLESVWEFKKNCELIILPFIYKALDRATITAEIDIPWLVNPRSTDSNQFYDRVQLSNEAGGAGVVIDNYFFHDLFQLGKTEKYGLDVFSIEKYIYNVLVKRLKNIVDLVK